MKTAKAAEKALTDNPIFPKKRYILHSVKIPIYKTFWNFLKTGDWNPVDRRFEAIYEGDPRWEDAEYEDYYLMFRGFHE